MNPFDRPAPASANPDEEVEAREHEAFMRTLDPAIVAAADWHGRREDGLDAGEEALFRQWLAADPAHASAYGEMDRSYAAVRSLPPGQVAHLRAPVATAVSPSSERATVGRHARTAQRANRTGRAGASAWSWLLPWPTGLAAACVVVVACGFGWYQWHLPTFTDHYATARGQRLDTALPDGSELKLDAATRAEVTLYRDRREARLDEGQAMFVVAPDPGKPFRVTAGSARITVVGTRFSVRHTVADGEPGAVEVAVEEGKVRVEGALPGSGDAPVAILAQGQAVRVSGAGRVGAVTAVAVSGVALWRKGLIRFSDTPLSQAIRELERYGPTRLVVPDPKIADLRIGGSFEVARPEELAKVLPSILPVKLVLRPDGSQEVVGAR